MTTRAGQIGLIHKAKGPAGWLIQVITRSKANHVIIALDDETCIGAEPGGAKIRPISYFEDVIWSDFDLTDTQRTEIVTWARAKEGTPYAYLADIAIGLTFLLGIRTPRRLIGYVSTEYILECAQLADIAYRNAGIVLFPDHFPGQIFPGSYIPLFKQRGWWTGPNN
jgi:hypothetical protein